MGTVGSRPRPDGPGVEELLGGYSAAFEAALRLEQEAYAEAVREEDERAQPFRARLLRVRHGLPVRMHLRDGCALEGRVTAVGVDWFRFTEGSRPGGVGAGRSSEIPMQAVVRMEVEGGTA